MLLHVDEGVLFPSSSMTGNEVGREQELELLEGFNCVRLQTGVPMLLRPLESGGEGATEHPRWPHEVGLP